MRAGQQLKTSAGSEENRPVYTLSIASQLSGIPSHSIRQYIDTGLLIPFKLESKRHLFSKSDIERLKTIQVFIQERGLNFSGVRALMATLPCWSIRKCPESVRKTCAARTSSFYPCWEASEKERHCKNEDCRECDVYHSLDGTYGVKSAITNLL